MSGTFILLHLAGNVALLLWGMHMVQTGILRAFGSDLRHLLATGLNNRFKAFLAGLGITAIIQSSTATALMASSFMAGGLMDLVPALAVLLGANVGSTLIVQLLSFNVAAAAPILVLAGVIGFKRGAQTRVRDMARVSIGLGLILLGLHGILRTMEPVEQATALRQLLGLLASDPAMDVAIGALVTWGAYSSVATVLLVMSLASTHVVGAVPMLALVLGANLGIIIPQYLGAGADPVARRLALGNLIIRGIGCLAAALFLTPISQALAYIDTDPARQAANFHTLFNLLLAIAFIGLLDPLARLCGWLLPAPQASADLGTPQYLTPRGSEAPNVAIADAQREVLRIVDLIELMLQNFADALDDDDRKKLAHVSALDDAIDRLHSAIKAHLIEASKQEGLSEADAGRCAETLAFTVNLEHVGDVLDTSLRELVRRKIKNRLTFASEGREQIAELREHALRQLRLAVAVFLHRDERSARMLIDEKLLIRDMAQAATDDHFQRLREGRAESIETSALYIDIIRDLKRITAHLASVAYPVLEEKGALRRSRLLESEATTDHLRSEGKLN
jgi:phosphate:Na+ symporter